MKFHLSLIFIPEDLNFNFNLICYIRILIFFSIKWFFYNETNFVSLHRIYNFRINKSFKTKKIILTLEKISDESLKIVIRDYGIQAPIESIKPRDLDDVKPGGLGIHFIKSSTKKMDYAHQADGGTLLTLVF